MPGKSNNYTLGEYGVNRVKSPVHLLDGELLSAQNAEVPFEKGNRGLRKRSGLRRFTTVAAPGAILSMSLIPLTDPDPGLPPVEIEVPPGGSLPSFGDLIAPFAGTGGVRRSVDGITWSTYVVSATAPCVPTLQDAYWFASGGVLSRFDGVTITDTYPLPLGTPTWANASADSTYLWWNTILGLERFNPSSGAFTTMAAVGLGNATAMLAVGSVFAFIGTSVFRLSGGAWINDMTVWPVGFTDHRGTKLVGFESTLDVYLSTQRDTFGLGPLEGGIIERDGGAWTPVYTSGTYRVLDMAATSEAIYAIAQASSIDVLILRSTDGATWTTDVVLAPTMFANVVTIGRMTAWGNDVFFTCSNSGAGHSVLRRNAATGTWAIADFDFYTMPSAVGFL